MSKQEEGTITVTFSEFLEYVLEEANAAKVKRPYHGALILANDPEERYVHVEFPSEDNKLDAPVVWRIKDWRDSTKRLLKLREISEIESAWRFKRDELIEDLARRIHLVFGADMPWCYDKAYKLYDAQDVNAAKVFGCDKLQDVFDTKPKSLKGKMEIRIK